MAGVSDYAKQAVDVLQGGPDVGRFQRIRILIVGLLVADILATALFVFMLGDGGGRLMVSYRAEFPTRLLVVRNQTKVFKDAQVVLDDQYRYAVPRLDMGLMGIDLRDFRDDQGLPPDMGYHPRNATILTPQDRYDLRIGTDDAR